MLSNVGTVDDISDFGRVTILVPVAALDGLIIVWVFSSLTKLINKLSSRNQMVKLSMYRSLYKALLFTAGVSVTWMLYEMYFRVADASNIQWKSEWISTCFWKSMTLFLTVVVCFLWAPNKISARFACSEQLDGKYAAGSCHSHEPSIKILTSSHLECRRGEPGALREDQ